MFLMGAMNSCLKVTLLFNYHISSFYLNNVSRWTIFFSGILYIYTKVEVLEKIRSGDTKQTLRPDVQTNSE